MNPFTTDVTVRIDVTDGCRTIMALDVADHMLRDRCTALRMDGMQQSADALQRDRHMLSMLRGEIMANLLRDPQ